MPQCKRDSSITCCGKYVTSHSEPIYHHCGKYATTGVNRTVTYMPQPNCFHGGLLGHVRQPSENL